MAHPDCCREKALETCKLLRYADSAPLEKSLGFVHFTIDNSNSACTNTRLPKGIIVQSPPGLTRPKIDPKEHGTEITVEKVKPEQRLWFAKAANRSILKRELSRAYSAMLRPSGVPTTFRLLLNGSAIQGRQHCVRAFTTWIFTLTVSVNAAALPRRIAQYYSAW